MRLIKFRAWEKLHKRMWNVAKINFQTEDYFTIEILHPVVGFTSFPHKEIELMQFTGLTDKNGVAIYEGDIVAIEEDFDGWYGGEVKFAEGKFYVDYEDFIEWDDIGVELEVKGNIYENPELLSK